MLANQDVALKGISNVLDHIQIENDQFRDEVKYQNKILTKVNDDMDGV